MATPGIHEHTGARADLRPHFALAEDSPSQLDAYLHDGRVLVAVAGDEVLAHLQLTTTTTPDALEVKNMAVVEAHRRQGLGRRLMDAAATLARAEGRRVLLVATAAADVDNLAFYQRLGFRMRSVERDAFGPATGYPEGLLVDGIELRDRVWLDLDLAAT